MVSSHYGVKKPGQIINGRKRRPATSFLMIQTLACPQCPSIPHGRHWSGFGLTTIGTLTNALAARICSASPSTHARRFSLFSIRHRVPSPQTAYTADISVPATADRLAYYLLTSAWYVHPISAAPALHMTARSRLFNRQRKSVRPRGRPAYSLSKVRRRGCLGSNRRQPSSPQCGGIRSGGAALRASTPLVF